MPAQSCPGSHRPLVCTAMAVSGNLGTQGAGLGGAQGNMKEGGGGGGQGNMEEGPRVIWRRGAQGNKEEGPRLI